MFVFKPKFQSSLLTKDEVTQCAQKQMMTMMIKPGRVSVMTEKKVKQLRIKSSDKLSIKLKITIKILIYNVLVSILKSVKNLETFSCKI